MYETEAMTSCYRGILENETVKNIIYDIMLYIFRSKIDYYVDNKEGNVCEWEQSTWSPFYSETRIQ